MAALMAELPTGYLARAPQERDAAAIAEVVKAHDIADYGEPDFTHEDLVDDWMRPRFDARARTRGCSPARPVGSSGTRTSGSPSPTPSSRPTRSCCPSTRVAGSAGSCSTSSSRVRARSCDGRPMTLGIFASGANDDKRHLLERRGFSFVRSVLRMRIDLSREPVDADRARRPTSSIGPLDPADLDAVRGRSGSTRSPSTAGSRPAAWTSGSRPGSSTRRSTRRCGGSRRSTVRSSAAISVFDVGDTGYTSTVAVRASSRGQGHRSGAGAGRVRGAAGPGPDAGGGLARRRRRPGLLGLYEAAGMRVHERHDLFVKPVS